MNSNKDDNNPTGISAHFEREAKLMLGFILMLPLLALLAGLFGPWILRQIDIDKCLDRGGAFDKESGNCKFSMEIKNTNNSQIVLPIK